LIRKARESEPALCALPAKRGNIPLNFNTQNRKAAGRGDQIRAILLNIE
jgi:hypothetical protein